MADDWKKILLSEAVYASFHCSTKWPPHPAKRASVPGGTPISIGFTGKVGGEASSAASISSRIPAKVEVVDGAVPHAGRTGYIAPIAAGVVAKEGVGEYSDLSSGTPLAEQASGGCVDNVRRFVCKQYICEGICRTDDGSPCFFERSVLIIMGFPQKMGGPCVPGTMLRGMCNRLCIDCYIAKYMNKATSEDLEKLRKHWKQICKKSHRQADKYNKMNKEDILADRPPTLRKVSEQQQARVDQWSLAVRDITQDHPCVSKRAIRNFVLAKLRRRSKRALRTS